MENRIPGRTVPDSLPCSSDDNSFQPTQLANHGRWMQRVKLNKQPPKVPIILEQRSSSCSVRFVVTLSPEVRTLDALQKGNAELCLLFYAYLNKSLMPGESAPSLGGSHRTCYYCAAMPGRFQARPFPVQSNRMFACSMRAVWGSEKESLFFTRSRAVRGAQWQITE